MMKAKAREEHDAAGGAATKERVPVIDDDDGNTGQGSAAAWYLRDDDDDAVVDTAVQERTAVRARMRAQIPDGDDDEKLGIDDDLFAKQESVAETPHQTVATTATLRPIDAASTLPEVPQERSTQKQTLETVQTGIYRQLLSCSVMGIMIAFLYLLMRRKFGKSNIRPSVCKIEHHPLVAAVESRKKKPVVERV